MKTSTIIILSIALLAIAGIAYFFFKKTSGTETTTTTTTKEDKTSGLSSLLGNLNLNGLDLFGIG